MVGENAPEGRHDPDPVPVCDLVELLANQVHLARGLADRPILQHVEPRREGDRGPGSRAGEVHEEQFGTVPDEEPRTVVVRRATRRQHCLDGGGRAGLVGQGEGELAP